MQSKQTKNPLSQGKKRKNKDRHPKPVMDTVYIYVLIRFFFSFFFFTVFKVFVTKIHTWGTRGHAGLVHSILRKSYKHEMNEHTRKRKADTYPKTIIIVNSLFISLHSKHRLQA